MDILNQFGALVFRVPDDWDPIFENRDLLAGANLRGARLAGVDLGNANLSRSCLADSDLYHAFLASTNLSHADLAGADLRGCDLEDSDLTFANLKDADLSPSAIGVSTRLGGVNFIGANLENARLTDALYDPSTKFPEGFDPQSHGMRTFEELQQAIERRRENET